MTESSNPPQSQLGPCGILCGSCPLGSGAVAESAGQHPQAHLRLPDPHVVSLCARRRGHRTRAAVDRALDWMTTYARCAGCRSGGGPPDCAIRICAREKGYELCSSCADLEGCNRFEWLGEHGQQVKEKLKECRGSGRRSISGR